FKLIQISISRANKLKSAQAPSSYNWVERVIFILSHMHVHGRECLLAILPCKQRYALDCKQGTLQWVLVKDVSSKRSLI
ncbi:hypothetical protein FRX31_024616, partial [Thalictrum thalictroides]